MQKQGFVLLFYLSFLFVFSWGCADKSSNNASEASARFEDTTRTPEQKRTKQTELSLKERKHALKTQVKELTDEVAKSIEKMNKHANEGAEQAVSNMKEKIEEMNIYKHELRKKIETIDSAQEKEAMNIIESKIERLRKELKMIMPDDSVKNASAKQ